MAITPADKARLRAPGPCPCSVDLAPVSTRAHSAIRCARSALATRVRFRVWGLGLRVQRTRTCHKGIDLLIPGARGNGCVVGCQAVEERNAPLLVVLVVVLVKGT